MPRQTRKAQKRRKIICQDAMKWLPLQKNMDSIVTSIPEMEEMKMSMKEYPLFFRSAARACFDAVKDSGYAVFLQTDRKYHGWFDKSFHISAVAEEAGFYMVWHKIALRTDIGKTDLFRPTYSHMLCYTKTGAVGKPFPDVLARGEVTYSDAFGRDAVRRVCEYLKGQGVRTIVDPFVGSGTTVAVANELGMMGIGLDIDPAQCTKARLLR
jgi:hypothetical protein